MAVKRISAVTIAVAGDSIMRRKMMAILMAATNHVTIDDLRDKLVSLSDGAKGIQARADAEQRPLTKDEEAEVEAIFATFDSTEQEIARRERLEAQERRLAAAQPRVTTPADAPVTAAPQAARPARTFESNEPKGTWGWRSFGEFAAAVRAATRGRVDNRLVANAPTTYSSEGTNADGGYAVPPDFRNEIVQMVQGPESLLGRTDKQTTSSNQMTVPIDETTAWQGTGGIQATWEGEAGQIDQSKIALTQITVRAHKLTALVPVTDELLEDVPALSNYLRRKTPEKLDYKISDAIINGDGVGKPTGLLNATSKIAVAKEDAQIADTVNYLNIIKMWARMYAPYRNNAVWLINQDLEPQLMQLTVPAASGQLAMPAYLPPGGLSGAPYATLLGKPVIAHEACKTVGDEGDIILTDLSQYLSVTKTSGVRQDVSIHLWFEHDVTAFRWVMRVGGRPWLSSAIARASGANTLSSVVTLAARA